jgi:hypothetical protein
MLNNLLGEIVGRGSSPRLISSTSANVHHNGHSEPYSEERQGDVAVLVHA